MTLRKTMMAVACLALPFTAQAQSVNGLYIAGGAGWNWHDTFDADISSALSAPSGFYNMRTETEVGSAVVASVGWGFGNGLRVELEGNKRSNKVSRTDISVLGFPLPAIVSSDAGRIRTTGVMANVFYDFNIGGVMPYVGAGIGFGRSQFNNIGPNTVWPFGIRGSDTNVAYQAIAGIAIPIASVPGLAITGEYRYYSSEDLEVNTAIIIPNGPSLDVGKTTVDNHEHSVMFGLRYSFGAR